MAVKTESVWIGQYRFSVDDDDWKTCWDCTANYQSTSKKNFVKCQQAQAHNQIVSPSSLGYEGWQEMIEENGGFRDMVYREMKRRGLWRIRKVEVLM